VAAVSAFETPVSVAWQGGWTDGGGTSVASPLIAGIEAHASAFARSLPGADAFYSDPSARFDVTAGANGECEIEYLCHAQVGYDGPTGVGAPNGPLLLTGAPPIVATSAPTAVTSSAATLNGAVDPQGAETTYHFEYGTTTSYGTSAPVPSATAGSGNAKEAVSQAITGLQSGTTYHYRLVATNSNGTSDGEDSVFKTAPPTVTGVTPRIGPAAGGTSVTISGTNFAGVSAVKFGSTKAKSFVVSSETSLRAVDPAGSGTVDVTVTTPAGTSATSSADHFAYEPSPWATQTVPLVEGSNASFGDGIVNCSFPPFSFTGLSCGGVSCASHAFCMAVGISNWTPIVENWNGTGWSVQALPIQEGSYPPAEIAFTGVSCTSPSTCIAVGYEQSSANIPRRPIADTWSNGQWSVSPISMPPGAKEAGFEGVSCSSSSECTAVGLSVTSSGADSPFISRWTAGTWSEQSTPTLSEATNADLEGVSCPSSTSCTAVGVKATGSGSQSSQSPLIESWNGEQWSLESAAPTSVPNPALTAVSCTSAAACMAVGNYGVAGDSTGLAERWDGHEWSVQSTAHGGSQEEFAGVSCSTSEECTAVGTRQNSGGLWVAMVQRWNGVAWTLQATTLDETQASELRGVSCVLESTCAAVGTFRWSAGARSVTGQPTALVEIRGETHMAEQPTPPVNGATHMTLSGASCATSVACTAVGSYTNSSGAVVTLAERSNGGAWTIESTPNPNGAKESRLSGVSCASASSCSAVGFYKTGGGSPSLSFAESWNGKEWKLQTTENPLGATKVQLLGVSCSATGACAAVGTYTNSASEKLSLAERLSGSEWKIQATLPPPGAKGTELRRVSCTSPSECTAVGSYTNSSGTVVTVAERLTGSESKIESTPNPSGATAAELSGISCPSASACTAVGSYTNGSGNSVSFAEGWNGKEWNLQTTQSPTGAVQSKNLGVSCSAGGVCTAVGWYRLSTGSAIPLAELWNGREWQPWSAPSPAGSEGSELQDVSCVSMYACAAVGQNTSKAVQVSLAEGLGAPGASTGAASNITATSATVAGSVTPNGWVTSYHVEFGPTTSYGSSAPIPDAGLASETTAEAIQQQTLHFPPGPTTTYHFRLVASNAAGTTYGKDQTFIKVAVPPPSVSTGSATNVTTTGATLTGTVTPNSWPTTYHFEYGLTSSYGRSVPVPDASLKSETAAEEVSQTIVLAPGRTYHFRLVARHAGEPPGEPVYGEDRTLTTPAVPAPSFTSSFGSLGTGGEQFNDPEGVAVDSEGNVWVTERFNNRVQEFSPTGAFKMTLGWHVKKNGADQLETCTIASECQAGTAGSGNGQFHEPVDIAVEKGTNNLWVGEFENSRVQEFSSVGNWLASIPTVRYTAGVALDPSGNVWVTSSGYGSVQEFEASPPHKPLRQFSVPATAGGVAADSHGNIWVVAEDYNRVEEFSPEGQFLLTFGKHVNKNGSEKLETCTSECQAGIQGSGEGQMSLPGSVAVGEKGMLWVSDVGNNRVEEFTPTGEYITQFGSGGSGEGQFSRPWGPAVSGGSAYVTDRSNNRVQKWAVSE
jgi:hypothetical protein